MMCYEASNPHHQTLWGKDKTCFPCLLSDPGHKLLLLPLSYYWRSQDHPIKPIKITEQAEIY